MTVVDVGLRVCSSLIVVGAGGAWLVRGRGHFRWGPDRFVVAPAEVLPAHDLERVTPSDAARHTA